MLPKQEKGGAPVIHGALTKVQYPSPSLWP